MDRWAPRRKANMCSHQCLLMAWKRKITLRLCFARCVWEHQTKIRTKQKLNSPIVCCRLLFSCLSFSTSYYAEVMSAAASIPHTLPDTTGTKSTHAKYPTLMSRRRLVIVDSVSLLEECDTSTWSIRGHAE